MTKVCHIMWVIPPYTRITLVDQSDIAIGIIYPERHDEITSEQDNMEVYAMDIVSEKEVILRIWRD